jgi:hypothetical protein
MVPMMNEAEDRRERMQRVRVGLTGLAAILLVILLATVVLTQINQQAGGVTNVEAKDGDEPLSDLGVAPRAPENGPDNAASAPAPGQRP